jgi:tetratricopeptide (TPR) repeat protein
LQILDADPRFVEANYLLGVDAVAQAKLDRAEELYGLAYAWRPRWPVLTQAMANVAMTAEDFDHALRLYDETLQSDPAAADARAGRVRVLTYLGRHEEAIATTDRLLAEQWQVGDARYWRALNEAQLERYDAAWTDVEEAGRLVINAQVPKLAGLIAYRRGELEVSRRKFAEARVRDAADCESAHYLGLVLVDLRDWDATVSMLGEALACFDKVDSDLRAEIQKIRASSDPPNRQARQIARRERQLASNERMRATGCFNIAVAYYTMSQPAKARIYAEKLMDDEQFGPRAKEILSRLK